MNDWVRSLWGSKNESSSTTKMVTAGHSVDDIPQWKLSVDIDDCYRTWLFGRKISNGSTNPTLERSALYALNRQAESSNFNTHLVPRIPTVLPQLMELLHDRAASTAKLSLQIGRDPSLIAEVIREANSPFYHPTDKVVSVDKAVLILGNSGLRMAVAKAFLRPIINIQSGTWARQVAPRLWIESEKCAMACCMLARGYQVNPFDAFLAGLLKNLGMTVALRVIDQVFNGENTCCAPNFFKAVEGYAKHLCVDIVKIWDMPETVVTAIHELGHPESAWSVRSALGKTLLMGDRLSKTALMVTHGHLNEAELSASGFSEAEIQCYQKLKLGLSP